MLPGQSVVGGSRFKPLLFALGLIVAGVVRAVYLGKKSLWLDESASSLLAGCDTHTFWTALLQRQGNMALYYFLLRGWTRLQLGNSEAVLRLPSVIFGVAAILVLYKLALIVAGTRAAWIASFLIAINLFHIQYSQEARGYTLLVFLALLSCYLFMQVLATPTKRRRATYIVGTVLMVYAHVFGVWIVLAQWLSALWLRPDRRRAATLDALITGLCIAPLALSLMLISDRSQLSWMSPASTSSLYAVLLDFGGGDFGGGAGSLLFLLFVIFILFSLHGRLRSGEHDRGISAGAYVFLWVWFLLPIVGGAIISRYRPVLQARYLIVCLPAFLLLVADGLARLRSRLVFAAALAAITGCSLVGLNAYYRARADQNHSDNWRDATAYCVSQAQPGDAVLFPYSAEEIPFRDYERRLGKFGNRLVILPQKTELELLSLPGAWTNPAQAGDAASRYRRLWVISALQPSAASQEVEATMRAKLGEESRRDFGFVRVRLFGTSEDDRGPNSR
jgi:uncharacterized membrane protein